MSVWRARIAVLAVFLAGFVAGAASLRLYLLRIENRIFHAQDVAAQLIVYKLDQELSLTPAQKAEAQATILAGRADLLRLRADLLPNVLQVFESGQSRIRASLTPHQRIKFDAIVAERRRLMQEIWKRPLPPGPRKESTP